MTDLFAEPGGGLSRVRRFRLPATVLDATLALLVPAARAGQEAFVVWGGRAASDHELRFTSALRPRQRALATPDGLLVTVDGDALFEVNRTLFARGEILAGQLHTHPTDAYHSDTDDHYPLVTLLGALSVVVPDFGRAGRGSLPQWAWYRLVGCGQFQPVDAVAAVVLEA
jgi:hypothetical protein